MTDFVNIDIDKEESPKFILGFLLVMLSLMLLLGKVKRSNLANDSEIKMDSQVDVRKFTNENIMLLDMNKKIGEVNSSE